MPKSNEKDLRDVPAEVKQNMAFTFVERMDEVLHLALLPAPLGVADVTEPEPSTGVSGSSSRVDREDSVAARGA
jgi:hypothetical protein